MAYWLSAVFDSSFSFPYRWNHDTVEKERKWGKEGTGKRWERRKRVWGGETVTLYLDTLAPSPWVMLLFSIFIITSFPLKNHPPILQNHRQTCHFRSHSNFPIFHPFKTTCQPPMPYLWTPSTPSTTLIPPPLHLAQVERRHSGARSSGMISGKLD